MLVDKLISWNNDEGKKDCLFCRDTEWEVADFDVY